MTEIFSNIPENNENEDEEEEEENDEVDEDENVSENAQKYHNNNFDGRNARYSQ
ncbi:hypothetical protein IMG5_135000 [Ichthyophthirius multifiliis]|uniref:Uncharacterized protein n=1 Tax=Ichthyophthirius multifiliis TaxID=5932 RepID=G0QWT7_ICHMU|nr:hypothetical protein IMG5_135000 [Ichthyophthirius multifiliis]EGR30326.1 hypothetical protein IMG5_135000 [Ichthyophthirius multifiliis]|eukprot:XP_004031913.1 hypothetical protein IMG5_135000 [Ichthyophthirius multifiliis]